jgi:uncharacterized coiled-coil protein SlyX
MLNEQITERAINAMNYINSKIKTLNEQYEKLEDEFLEIKIGTGNPRYQELQFEMGCVKAQVQYLTDKFGEYSDQLRVLKNNG